MTLLAPEKTSPGLVNVPLIEVTDPVLGGLDGASNKSTLALFERMEYLRLRGITEYDSTFNYPANCFVQSSGVVYKSISSNVNKPPNLSVNNAGSGAVWCICPITPSELEAWFASSKQNALTKVATATTGTSTAFVLAVDGLAALDSTRLFVTFDKSNGGAGSTLNVNNLGAKALKQYDSTGALVNAVTFAGMKSDIVFDGTQWILLDPAPAIPMSFAPSAATDGIVANRTLTLADAGKIRTLEVSGLTITLPNSSTIPNGTTFYIKKRNQSNASATIVGLDNASRSFTISNVSAGLYAITAGYGNQVGDVYGVQFLPQADLPTSKTANGYVKMPDGLIFQWGRCLTVPANGANGTVFSFPIAFPNECFQMVGADYGSACGSVGVSAINNYQYQAEARDVAANGAYATIGVQWFAIGY